MSSFDEPSNENSIPPSSMDNVQLRRYACDRCRGHKLRCERRSSGGDINSCERCTKARVTCFTSPPLRMGRPRHKTPVRVSLSTAAQDTFDFEEILNTNSRSSFLEPVQLQHIAVSSSSTASLSPLMSPLPAVDSSRNSKVQPMDTLFDYEWSSEHMFVEPSPFQDFQTDYPGMETQTPSPRALKHEYLEKLANLNSTLFKQLNPTGPSQTAGTSYFPSSSVSTLRDLSDGNMTPNASRYPIGQILESSQRFIGILKYFLLSSTIKPSSSQQSRSETIDSDCEREDEVSNTRTTSSTMHTHLPSSKPPNVGAGHDPTVHCQPSLPNSSGLLTPSTLGTSLPHHLDLPTILSILSCYVSLMRIYHTVLTQIYNVLQTSDPLSPVSLPPILPGLSLDGFSLEHHYSLQINILAQVSMDLLHRIEKAVAALAGGETFGDAGGAFGWKGGYSSLLEMVLRQEALKGGRQQQQQGGMESLRVLVKKIKRGLEEDYCMQMKEAEASS